MSAIDISGKRSAPCSSFHTFVLLSYFYRTKFQSSNVLVLLYQIMVTNRLHLKRKQNKTYNLFIFF
ncbi:hypothetical protein CLOSTASPAR_01760 [[Clostridium] asparagiforme DSM 15981]|uniref:Uncharacterized protein n=1 Tax=[Clostridium] asparagiforme DSM 15981 TaxID=518636 RepID=C0CXN4_9FIRM|nr:hypothetical protein CLOSTASPAR_01760 [[Clostridium] asparagiforme DSM 15981]